MKKWPWFAVVFSLSFLLISCGEASLIPTKSSNDPINKNSKKVVLEFWHTYSDIETKAFESKVLPLFEKQYPNIQIHAVRQDYTDQLNNNILAAVADNKQPDVMRMDMIWVPQFAKSGALVDLSTLEGFNQIQNNFIGALMQTNLYKNKYYGIPVNANTKMAIYNTNLLHEAGLQAPPHTFQEVIQATQRLKKKNSNLFGMGICCSSTWGTLPYFWTFGGVLTNEEHTKATGYLNSPASIAAIKKIKQLYDQRIISPYFIIGGGPGGWDGVLKGQLLMIDEAHWFYSVNATGKNKELLKNTTVALFPSDVSPGTSIIGGENLVLFNHSKYQKEAWTFMKWLVSEKPQEIMAETGLIPTIKDIKLTNINPLYKKYLEQLKHAKPRTPVPAWNEIDHEFARMMEKILTNEIPLQQAVNQSAVKIDQLLANE